MSTKKPNTSNRTNNFNYKIARYFLQNHRLMILSLLFLTVLGIVSTFALKTTGFPEPQVNVVLVQTVYPGAAADTITKDITQPIEGALKDIDGISTYQSQTTNGISVVSVSTEEDAEPNTVRAEIETAIESLDLPEGSEAPAVRVGAFDGPDIIFSIAGKNTQQIYDAYEQIEKSVNNIPETASVTAQNPIERFVVITLQSKKQAASGIDQAAIEQSIASIGQSIPVAGNVEINEKNQTITTTFNNATLGQVKNLVVGTNPNGDVVRLKEIANVTLDYRFVDGNIQHVGVKVNNAPEVFPAMMVQIAAADGTNIAEYTAQVEEIFSNTTDTTYLKPETKADLSKPLIVEHFTSNESNQDQVDEVVSGLIGGKLAVDGAWANAGFLLGGVQLVFLVMLAFVSWRAAIVSTIAIPLSLVFSTIYLYFIGEDLNTLVLFSLVLVIGLVVDPTLVILESIQRKIDAGLKGTKAALAAVQDVGPGLFLATLTNIIVFLPFGLISGILGEIFSYIPLTIIPAVVGSYIVPLIFLAWIGGLFLRKNKKSVGTEEENLWGIARLIIRINTRLLNGSVIVRMIVIAVAFVVPLAVTGWYFSEQKIRVVQFSSSDNTDFLQIAGTVTNDTPKEKKAELEKKVIAKTLENGTVEEVYPTGDGFQYAVNLQPAVERGEYRSTAIQKDIQTAFEESEFTKQFFDLTIDVASIGPPAQSYQIALAVSGADTETMQKATVAVGKAMEMICEENGSFRVDENCSGNRVVNKVNDGITGQENRTVEVLLNREKLFTQQLTVPNAPLALLVNQFLRGYFTQNTTTPVATVTVDDRETDVVIESNKKAPKTVQAIKNTVLLETPLATVRVSDVADVQKSVSPSAIRRTNGETVSVVQARVAPEYNDQATIGMIAQTVLDYYKENDSQKLTELNIPKDGLESYSEGDNAAAARSFQDLLVTLVLAIVVSYIVLALFFKSFSSPLVILFSIPLSFLGIFPALAHLGNGQFGFLEIIGLIILIGIVENVAIFLLDAANQKMEEEGWDVKRAIAYASGVRFRPVILTKCTALASLAPLAILSETYRPISLVIMFGLLTSGFTSLFTTPILFAFFRWLSAHFYATQWWNKILFLIFSPLYMIGWALSDRRKEKHSKEKQSEGKKSSKK